MGFDVAHARDVEPRIKVDWNLSPTDKVGSRKSGAACFPNGTLIWQEIAKPDLAELIGRLEPLLPPSSDDEQILATLVNIRASVCTPWLGLVKAKPKSTFKISIRWTFAKASGALVDEIVETELTNKQLDLRFDPALFSAALEASLREALSKER